MLEHTFSSIDIHLNRPLDVPLFQTSRPCWELVAFRSGNLSMCQMIMYPVNVSCFEISRPLLWSASSVSVTET